jgi:hypothetical protein
MYVVDRRVLVVGNYISLLCDWHVYYFSVILGNASREE